MSQPQRQDVAESSFDKGLWIRVISVLMVIPALLCMVVNAAFGEGLTWSLYVVASLGMVWVWCVSPFLYRRNIAPLWIALDAFALLGLLYLIDSLAPKSGWFVPLALPITLGLDALLLLITTLVRRRTLRELNIVAAVLMAFGVYCAIIEGAVDLYQLGTLKLQWSLLVLVTCAPLSAVAMMLQRRRSVVDSMKMWFRI